VWEDIGMWKTKDGRILKIKDMDTQHLKNTMNMLNRNIEKLENRIMEGVCMLEESSLAFNVSRHKNKVEEIKNELLNRI
jgi:hypothetical protein